jgi:Na+-driven multidrug efflux pump
MTAFIEFTILYVIIQLQRDIKEAWFLPNKESFQGIIEYLKLGIYSLFMSILYVWSMEIIIILSGYLSIDETSASVIALNAFQMCLTLN